MRSSQVKNERIEIAERAYALWGAAGQPPGRNLEFWLQAETELEAAKHGRTRKANPSDPGHRRPPQKA